MPVFYIQALDEDCLTQMDIKFEVSEAPGVSKTKGLRTQHRDLVNRTGCMFI